MKKTLKPGSTLHRSFALDRAAINEEMRTVELAFSSETPYDRYWGREILDHSQNSIRLGRLTAGGPLLMDHDARDHVGVIESVQIGADRVGRAVVRFGKSARANEVWQDVVDGIRRNVSVGYMIHDAVLVEKSDTIDTYRVTDWEPFEVSMVAVPADASVGVGRAADQDTDSNPVIYIKESKEIKVMDKQLDAHEIEQRGAEAVQKRVNEIIGIGQQYKCQDLAAEYVRSGKSVEEFKNAVIERMATNPSTTNQPAEIGMTDKEVKRYSILRAINALQSGNWKDAGIELEASRAVAKALGKDPMGIYLPYDVMARDLVVGTPTAGGNLVSTDLLSMSFIDMLRNALVLNDLGARMLTGLVGNIAIPRQTSGATAYWVGESGAPTESQAAFDQVAMSPKTVGAFTDLSRKLLLQSSIDAEAFARLDLANTLAAAIDIAGINGSGSGNEPRGILNTSGIGSVVGGTDGAAPTWANIVELETDVSVANANVGNLAYLTNTKVRGKLKTTSKVSGQNGFIWDDGDLPLNGYRGVVSNQVPSNLTKGSSNGVCSGIIFGNWADLIIGMWGGLDINLDTSTGSTSGTVRVVALQDVDIAVRHAESFAAMKDALTA